VHEGREIVEIDGRRYAVRRLHGPSGPALEIGRGPAGALRLGPWTLADHLAALDTTTYLEGQAPRIDADRLAAAVLARTCDAALDPGAVAELTPLALWWAGGAAPPAALGPGGALELAAGRALLRRWSSLARARALDACTDPRTGDLRVGSYLRAMVVASTSAAFDPLALAGDDAAVLLDAVTALNAPRDDLASGPGSTELARATLRVCRALGWTPGQVWATDAVELDRLLALLDRVEQRAPAAPVRRAPPPPVAPGSRLAAFPDAVVIEVSDG
jgi:hypothetical protein